MWDARGCCCGGWCPIRLAEAVTAERTHSRLQVSPALAGLAFTLASAVFMSGLGVTTQLAFDAGAPMGTLLSGRFLVAAALLWPLVLWPAWSPSWRESAALAPRGRASSRRFSRRSRP
jgi:hypothetical protein